MTSSRNNSRGSRLEEDALLDAARDCVLAVGLRRTTLTDVARRAGVSRMTMYRRWPDMTSLVGDLMTREWTALVREAFDAASGDTARARFVSVVVRTARRLREHPMFRRIVELDPEVLLPYLVHRRGTSQDRILAMSVAALAKGDDGSIRREDPELLARGVLLLTHGFVLSAQTMTDTVATADLDRELELLLDRYLLP
jgi:AcrR family transcriptional regulator